MRFKAVRLESRGGGGFGSQLARACKVYATEGATVQDLMACAHSDAMWLKADGDVLGTHCKPTERLHELADARKTLSVVVSSEARHRPGKSHEIMIELLQPAAPDEHEQMWAQAQQQRQPPPPPPPPQQQQQQQRQPPPPPQAAGRRHRIGRKSQEVAGKIGAVEC